MAVNKMLKQQLRAQAHKLKPVVIIGAQGLTDAVQAEINHALTDHELIKVRINAETAADRRAMIQQICDVQGAELIQHIGHIGTFFRKNPDA